MIFAALASGISAIYAEITRVILRTAGATSCIEVYDTLKDGLHSDG